MVNKQNDFCGITNWHKHGITGKGITVLNCEKLTTHGRNSRRRILDSAPDACVINGQVSYATKNGKVAYHIVTVDNDGGTAEIFPFEDFIRDNHIRILSASKSPDPFNPSGKDITEIYHDLASRYGLCFFVSSGNDHAQKNFTGNDISWLVGALQDDVDNIKRASYSNMGEGLDFADFTGGLSGTSFSAPYLAGKAALILQRYPEMTNAEMYEYMKKNCMDLGEPGEDKKFGHGLVILPDDFTEDEEVEITKTKVLQYHRYAGSRYEALGLKNTLPLTTTTFDDVEKAVAVLKSYGLNAVNGM